MEIRTVGVVGAGLMGSGIAEVCARSGLRNRVAESNEEALAAGRRRVERSLQRGHQGGKLRDEDVERITGRLTFRAQLDEFADCDIVIEAIVGLNAAYAFDLSGDEGGVYHTVLADGRGEAARPPPRTPTSPSR